MDKISECVTLSMNGEIAVISVDNPPVNAIGAAVRSGIADALNTALASPEVSATILICRGRSFFAGSRQ
jgi:3-hydroxyacyl-CoA dehydrogenase